MDTVPRFSVSAVGLNLRSEPRVRPGNRLAVLTMGHQVTVVEPAEDPDWLRVTTTLDGRNVSGFLARRFVVPVAELTREAVRTGVTEVHLRRDHPESRRDVAGRRAFPLGEPGRPARRAGNDAAAMRSELLLILDWLDVERSVRYLPQGRSTFCNIYAYDYCDLAGTYLPRVWWTQRAVADLEAGRAVVPEYGRTVLELNANALFDWLRDFGPDFGWARTFDPDELQAAANHGGVGLICAQRIELNQPGHITVVVPESGVHAAGRRDERVTTPLQSQAGTTNRKRMTTTWWTHSRFRQFGFWIHA